MSVMYDVHKLAINHKKKTSKRVTTPTDGSHNTKSDAEDIWKISLPKSILRNDKFGRACKNCEMWLVK